MTLFVKNPVKKPEMVVSPGKSMKVIKIRLYEVQELTPCNWTPTGRSLYVDSDAPLQSIAEWASAKTTGEAAIRKSMFDSIVRIVEEQSKMLDLLLADE